MARFSIPQRTMQRNIISVLSRASAAFVAVPALFIATITEAGGTAPWPVVLRKQMARITDVGFRLDRAATPLCPSTISGTGLTIDHIGAYDARDQRAVAQLLGLSQAPQIAAVATSSPADLAGVRAGDDLIAIDGIETGKLLAATADHSLFSDALEERLGATPSGQKIHLRLRHDGQERDVTLQPIQICGARYVIKTGDGIEAFSDSKNVAISSNLIKFARNDDELALVAGHELGHVINRDDEAKSLGERRSMEDRADLLGAGLARCAGYDPMRGVEFWLRYNAQDWLRLFRSPSHRSPKSRVELMRRDAMAGPCPPTVGLVGQVVGNTR